MNNYIRRADERGFAEFGWLKSHHTFSFGGYYDPKHMGVSVLRVINDDVVTAGAGFDTHGHRDMEIISYVIEGALKHEDSEGNKHIIPAGDVQRMSAGTGIYHSEYNASTTESVNFLQIWIKPNTRGLAPGYEQKTIVPSEGLSPIVTPSGSDTSLRINQDVSIYKLNLKQGASTDLAVDTDRIGYIHIIKGELELADTTLKQGDALSAAAMNQTVSALSDVEALWFDLPTK